MRRDQLRRFLNSDVVGQLNNGLLFEGHILDKAGKTSVLEHDSQMTRQISATRVKWVAKAVRYC
jgi:hypothetical protein